MSLSEESMPHRSPVHVALLSGGQDRHYAFGLATALLARDVRVELIGSDEVDSPELHGVPNLTFLNLQGSQRLDVGLPVKIRRLLVYYVRLLCYAATAKPPLFHILWNNRLQVFDRTVLMLYYKALGKKVVLTAHNVNAGRRDSNDSVLNRLTLGIQYRLADHIFVHTAKMLDELSSDFGIARESITVIRYGINNAVPNTELTSDDARRRMGINNGERVILFFGSIAPIKDSSISSAHLNVSSPRTAIIVSSSRES